MRMPNKLSVGGRTIAICTHDKHGRRSVRVYDVNEGRGLLMGTPGAKRIGRWLIRASEWIKSQKRGDYFS